jgi:hypothetical protein
MLLGNWRLHNKAVQEGFQLSSVSDYKAYVAHPHCIPNSSSFSPTLLHGTLKKFFLRINGSKNIYYWCNRLANIIPIPLPHADFRIGYIGGHQVAPLLKKHPDYHIVALVRTEHQAKILKEAFPTAETILGDLDSDEILQAEAGKADVVLSKLIQSLFHTFL